MRWERLGVVLGLLGCGNSGDAGVQLPPQIATDVQTFADAYAHAWCDGLAACCRFWAFHQDACLTQARQAEEQAVASAVAASSIIPHLDTNAHDTCLAQIAAIVASCPATTFPALQAPACAYVFTPGTVPPGAACASTLDCAPPPGQVPSCVKGACEMPIADLPAGAACIDSEQCAAGLACDPGTSICGPKLALGAPCGEPLDCPDGAYCERLLGGGCKAFLSLGAACYDEVDECGPAAYCSPDTQSCQGFSATGSACSNSGECLPSDYCSTASSVCKTQVPVGGACPTGDTQPCADGGLCAHTSGEQSLPGDTSPFVCIPANLPSLCYAR